jgi:hypothetical protein
MGQVTSNLAEENHSRKKGERSMPIVHQHMTYLNDLASLFTKRLLSAQLYQAEGNVVVPSVLRKTVEGADYLKTRGWSVQVSGSSSLTGRQGSALSVTYSVSNLTCNPTNPQSYEVKITCDGDQEWYQNISCKCGRTKEYGRPCFHACLCLVYPKVTDHNAFVRDPQLFYYGRACWYSKQFLVSTMIQQYSREVKIPSFRSLNHSCTFGPMMHALPGRYTNKSHYYKLMAHIIR